MIKGNQKKRLVFAEWNILYTVGMTFIPAFDNGKAGLDVSGTA